MRGAYKLCADQKKREKNHWILRECVLYKTKSRRTGYRSTHSHSHFKSILFTQIIFDISNACHSYGAHTHTHRQDIETHIVWTKANYTHRIVRGDAGCCAKNFGWYWRLVPRTCNPTAATFAYPTKNISLEMCAYVRMCVLLLLQIVFAFFLIPYFCSCYFV